MWGRVGLIGGGGNYEQQNITNYNQEMFVIGFVTALGHDDPGLRSRDLHYLTPSQIIVQTPVGQGPVAPQSTFLTA